METELRIVIVHGIKNYRRGVYEQIATSLAKQFHRRLQSSPRFPWNEDDVSIEVAYYAHILRRKGSQGGVDLEPDAESFLRVFLQPWIPDLKGAQGEFTRWLHIPVARIASQTGFRQDIVEDFVKCFAREVTYFLRTEGRFKPKSAVIEHVSSCIEGADVVIAHSLGSIVAYETLWKNGITVPLFVTMGSPLAFPGIIFPRISPAPVNGKGSRPPGVRYWANIADVGDIIATPPGGISRQFRGVHYDRQDSIARFDFHKMTNYLRCRELGTLLQKWAEGSPPFARLSLMV
ncbi:hypothetical protein ACFQS3_09960 [Glycomyces mayteni]|uniref:Uncharacterized protein n=1 Tax=Glycomyces mayteni TaxID=543887 RepID=A0ABW2D8T9_9ACTN